jgi:paraquat-inducible protein A
VTIACPDCGTLVGIPPLPRHSDAFCARCARNLESTRGRSVDTALACAVATLLLLLPLNTLPLIKVTLYGQQSEGLLIAGIARLWHQGWILLAGLSGLFVIVVPFVQLMLLVTVLGTIRLGFRPRWLGRTFRWEIWLERWAMVDVSLVALGVGFYYLNVVENIDVRFEPGGFCLIAAGILAMLSRASLDERAVWQAIGGDSSRLPSPAPLGCRTCGLIQPHLAQGAPCARCGAGVRSRKRDAARWTTAMLAASFLLLFPANIFPMNVTTSVFEGRIAYTNFGYVRELWHLGLWPLGVLTFWTGVLTPAVMILALGWCVLSVWRGSNRRLVLKTRVFRLVCESGKWSKTGPFSIVIFVPLVDFGALGTETAAWGATAFIVMVLLIMLAASAFDPRLMWDAQTAAPLDAAPPSA